MKRVVVKTEHQLWDENGMPGPVAKVGLVMEVARTKMVKLGKKSALYNVVLLEQEYLSYSKHSVDAE